MRGRRVLAISTLLLATACSSGSESSSESSRESTGESTRDSTPMASSESTVVEPTAPETVDTGSPSDPPIAHQSPALDVTPGPCAATIAPGSTDHTLERAEGVRQFVLHRPDTPDGRRLPLVVDLHGTTGNPAAQEAISGFGARGVETGAWITMTPLALGAMTAWAVPGAIPGDDLGFIEDAIVQIVNDACVDPARIYATGISSGGAMSAYLGCESSLFAGVAPVAGVNLVRRCETSTPVTLVAFHGTADRYVPIEGLDGWNTDAFADPRKFYRGDLMGTVESWARRDGCADEATVTPMGPVTDRYEWEKCASGTEVVLYLSTGAGHTHPGASFPADDSSSVGAVARDIDATDLIAREFGLIT